MEELMFFIPEQLFIVIAAVYVMGMFLKRTGRISDNLIPTILMFFSIVFSLVLGGPSPISFLQGILCWGVAIGVNQVYKQSKKLSEEADQFYKKSKKISEGEEDLD